jgi:hypothetical protein
MTSSASFETAMARTVMNLLDRWQVNAATARRILNIDAKRYRAWRRRQFDQLDPELELRLALLLHTYASLRTIFRAPHQADAWMRKPNAQFGQTPLALLSSGDLSAIRRLQSYLAAETQPW